MFFNHTCFPKILFKVRRSMGGHGHRKSGSIKEIVQDRHIVTTHQ